MRLSSVLLLALWIHPALAVSVVCNGGNGAPYWAYTMQECLERARNQSGNDAKKIAEEAAAAEKRARDARRIGNQLANDRRAFEERSPEAQAALRAAPYVLAGGLAGLAAGLAAQRGREGEPALVVPRTYQELAANPDPSQLWKRLAAFEAEKATYLFQAASGGVDAAQKFNQLAAVSRERGKSMVTLDSGQVLLPARRGEGQGLQGGTRSEKSSSEVSAGGAGRSTGASAKTAGGAGAPAPAGQAARTKSDTEKSQGVSGVSAVSATGSDSGKSRSFDKTLPPLGDKKKDPEALAKQAKDSKKGGGNELALFEEAMNSADQETSSSPAASLELSDLARSQEEESSLFRRVSRQYQKRARLYYSPFGE